MTTSGLAVSAAALFMLSAAQAASDGDLATAIVNCSAQPNDTAQLACYNRIAARLKTSAAPTSPATTPVDAPVAAPIEAQAPAPPAVKSDTPTRQMIGSPADFGKADMPFQADTPQPLDHITAGVVNVTFNFFHHFTVTLDNGQVWRQEDGDAGVARFDGDKTAIVTISRGFLDSYHLAIQGRWGTFAVRRIK
jgi:hypothetical protein